MTDNQAPEDGECAMPSWAPPDGPWCLKKWLPLPSAAPPKYEVCLLLEGHDSDCRGQGGRRHNRRDSMFLGDHEGAHQ